MCAPALLSALTTACASSSPLSLTGTEQPDTFSALLHKKHGTRSDWEYPFAIAGVNITYMLIDALGILPVALGRSKNAQLVPCGPFLRILQHEKKARARLGGRRFAHRHKVGAEHFTSAVCQLACVGRTGQRSPWAALGSKRERFAAGARSLVRPSALRCCLLSCSCLSQNLPQAFSMLYALTFMRLDREWVHAGASYMQFNGAPPSPLLLCPGYSLGT